MLDIRIYGADPSASPKVLTIKQELAAAAKVNEAHVKIRFMGEVMDPRGIPHGRVSFSAPPFADIILLEGRSAEEKRLIAVVLAGHIPLPGGITFIEIPPENYFQFHDVPPD